MSGSPACVSCGSTNAAWSHETAYDPRTGVRMYVSTVTCRTGCCWTWRNEQKFRRGPSGEAIVIL